MKYYVVADANTVDCERGTARLLSLISRGSFDMEFVPFTSGAAIKTKKRLNAVALASLCKEFNPEGNYITIEVDVETSFILSDITIPDYPEDYPDDYQEG